MAVPNHTRKHKILAASEAVSPKSESEARGSRHCVAEALGKRLATPKAYTFRRMFQACWSDAPATTTNEGYQNVVDLTIPTDLHLIMFWFRTSLPLP